MPDPLTPRELQVLELVGRRRLTYQAAARELGVSSETVREHARRIRAKVAPGLRPLDAVIRAAHERAG